jgi:hypothetical protein
MAIVHFVKRAGKDYPEFGIVKGQPHWFVFLPRPRGTNGIRGKKIMFTYPPKPSQTTSNPFLKQLWQIREALESAASTTKFCRDDVLSAVQAVAEMQREQSVKIANLPKGLRATAISDTMRARASSLARIEADLRTCPLLASAVGDINWGIE